MELDKPLYLALSDINYSDTDSVQQSQVMLKLKIVELSDSLGWMHRDADEVL